MRGRKKKKVKKTNNGTEHLQRISFDMFVLNASFDV